MNNYLMILAYPTITKRTSKQPHSNNLLPRQSCLGTMPEPPLALIVIHPHKSSLLPDQAHSLVPPKQHVSQREQLPNRQKARVLIRRAS